MREAIAAPLDAQIEGVIRAARSRLIQLQGNVQLADAELRDELNQAKVDAHRADEAIEKVIAARSELMRAVSQLSLNLRLILTPAQWQELQKRVAERPAQPLRGDTAPPPPRNPGDRRPQAQNENPDGFFARGPTLERASQRN